MLEIEKQFTSLKDDIDFLEKNEYKRAQEKEWAEKLYNFNKVVNFLIDYYSNKNMQ